jgi:hypothetical protein
MFLFWFLPLQILLAGLPAPVLVSRLQALADLGVPAGLIQAQLPYFLRFSAWLTDQPEYE